MIPFLLLCLLQSAELKDWVSTFENGENVSMAKMHQHVNTQITVSDSFSLMTCLKQLCEFVPNIIIFDIIFYWVSYKKNIYIYKTFVNFSLSHSLHVKNILLHCLNQYILITIMRK